MKKLLIIIYSVLSLAVYSQNKKTVAVLNPICRDNSVSNIYHSIVRGSFESVASATSGYEAFDRSALDAIMQEHNMERSGLFDDAQIRQLGKFSGVDYVLVTDISADEGYLMVVAKILNVETAKYDRAVDGLMEMTPMIVKAECTVLAQSLFQINMTTGVQKGEIVWEGKRYVGEYKDGKPHGKGKLFGNEGSSFTLYEGGFSEGERNGYGVVISKDNTRYEGNWVNGSIDGEGKLYFANGFRYEGTFHDNNLTYGTLYLPNGDRYVGSLDNFLPDGRGTCYFTNGNKYVGNWDNGVKDGTGTYWWVNGNRYEGHFSKDEQHGKGTLFDKNGNIWSGTWQMGVMQGVFDVSWSDGSSYKVKVVNGEPTEVLK